MTMNPFQRRKQLESFARRAKAKKAQPRGMDWRDLAASIPQTDKPIKGKLPF
jgi:hypothetical protein